VRLSSRRSSKRACPILSVDAVTQVVEEFDDGESLLGCPVVGDQEVESVGQAGRLIIEFHGVLPAVALRFRDALLGTLAGLFVAIGFALEGDDLGVMDKTVDEGDDTGGVGKDLGPLRERAVGSDRACCEFRGGG
jgi:hypothetical protein